MPVMSAIAGGVAAAGAGALLGGGSSGGGAGASQYTPDYDINTGLFDTSLKKVGQETKNGVRTYDKIVTDMSMSPALQGISDLGLNTAEGLFGGVLTNPKALSADAQSLDFLNSIGATDPMEIAQQQFGLLNPILQDQQMQDYLGLESRLFSQGRTGGMGELSGQADLQTLFDSQHDAERKLLFDSLNQGLASQSHQFNMASGLSNLADATRSNQFSLGQGFLNIPLQLQEAMLNQAVVGSGLGGGNVARTSGAGGLNPIQTVGAGLLNSGVQGLSDTAAGLFQNFDGFGNTGSGVSPEGNYIGGTF